MRGADNVGMTPSRVVREVRCKLDVIVLEAEIKVEYRAGELHLSS